MSVTDIQNNQQYNQQNNQQNSRKQAISKDDLREQLVTMTQRVINPV